MDLRKLKKLIDLVEDSGIAELEVTEGEEKVKIVKGGSAGKELVVLSPSAVPVGAPPVQAVVAAPAVPAPPTPAADRKSTRLNSSHLGISYAVFCLKKRKKMTRRHDRNQRDVN